MFENEVTAPSSNGNAREAILASIRKSLAASRPFDAEHQKHHRSEMMPRSSAVPELPLDVLIENFRSNLTFVGAGCRIVKTIDEAREEARNLIEGHSAKRIAVSDSPLVAELFPDDSGIDVLRNASQRELFKSDLAITSAQWGIAETGTLVLESERESHRLTSLVPPVHLCVLRASDIRQTLGEVLEILNRDLSRTVTFITGASRTSDIELTLAIGVHGPRELHVIVLNDQ